MGRNERRTEELVRTHFRKTNGPRVNVDEQISSDPRIQRALSAASKRGAGAGRPEFILHSPDAPGFVVVIECKADQAKHASANLDRAQDFAVDGALRYAERLAQSFDVVAVAVSGDSASTLRVSTYTWRRKEATYQPLTDDDGNLITQLLPFDEYYHRRNFDPQIRHRNLAELMAFSRDLHNYMRDYAKVSEPQKPLLVSGILIALHDEGFAAGYRGIKAQSLPQALYDTVARMIDEADMAAEKKRAMKQPYEFLATHPVLAQVPANTSTSPLQQLLKDIDEHLRPFIATYQEIDVIGRFYQEFLRYTGGDKKGLGIVLTPRHVTELFAKLANVGPNDTVVDPCCGTGGFLISAMKEMDAAVGRDADKLRRIRELGLVGIEMMPEMFALAASNMILRGDGKASLFLGSCFDEPIIERIKRDPEGKRERPNVGLINPPYSQKGEGLHELNFVDNMLDMLVPGSVGIAIVPMSCAIDTKHPTRRQILEKHTLEAVMSMPDELFYPVGTITCIMVFRAGQPHARATRPTWFGYWKDDGHIKTKDQGRIDLNGRWAGIEERWLESFHARASVPGESILRTVTADDEWCAEAYMETDYSKLNREDFETVLRRFAIFRLLNGLEVGEDQLEEAA